MQQGPGVPFKEAIRPGLNKIKFDNCIGELSYVFVFPDINTKTNKKKVNF